MQFVNPNTTTFLHRGSSDISVTGITTTSVTVAVTVSSVGGATALSGTYSFTAKPVSGLIKIAIAEIISALKIKLSPTLDFSSGSESKELARLTITVTDADANVITLSPYVIDAYMCNVDKEKNYLTTRAKKDFTTLTAKEVLSVFADTDIASRSVTVRALTSAGRSLTTTLVTISQALKPTIWIVNVSPARIAQQLSLNAGESIVSYEVDNEVSQAQAHGRQQAYILIPDSPELAYFAYRNSLGVYDYIIARGRGKRSLDYEIQTIKTGRITKNIHNSSVTEYECNTGFIETVGQRNRWADFFRSEERYILKNGTFLPICIDTVKGEITDREIGTMTFIWKFSDEGNAIELQTEDFELY